MATFQITGPDGRKYRVTGDSPEGAMQALRKMVDASASAPRHPEFDPANVPGGVPGYNAETGMVEPKIGMGTSFMGGAADTASFGFGDEIAATIGSMATGDPRERVLAQMRDRQQSAQEQNPGSYLAGQITGAVAQGARAGPGFLANAPSLGGRVLGGALTGFGMGGAYGLGSGTSMASRMEEGIRGAGFGAVAGGAFPIVAHGAGKGWQAFQNYRNANPIAANVGTTPESLRLLGNVMDADDTLGAVGQRNMARAGGEAMLADAGPNARQVLDTSIQSGGRGALVAQRAIGERTARASDDLVNTLDSVLGAPQGVQTTRNAIRTGSAAARNNAYEGTAYKAAINYSDPRGMNLENIIKSRVPGRAIAEANELMRVDGHTSKQILAKVANDGSVTFEQLPDVRQIDYITRALNQMAESGDGAGALGGQTAKGRAYQNLSREIRDTLKDLVPEYGKALETAADPIRRSQAVEFGSKLFSDTVKRDQVEDMVKGMTGPEKTALMQGARANIDDAMARVTRTVQDGNTDAREAIKALRDMSSRANREKMTFVLGKKQADTLFNKLDQIAMTFDLRAAVTENSKTFARQNTKETVKTFASPDGPLASAKRGESLNVAKKFIQKMTGETSEKVLSREQAMFADLAELLTRRGGAGQDVYDAISSLGQTDAATQLMRDRIVRSLSGPRLAYPTGVQADKNTLR